MKRFTIKAGQHDFSPRDPLAFYTYNKSRLSWLINFNADCWYDSLGADNADWNKLGGITSAWSPNDQDSLLIGWRPDPQPGYFQVCIYENIGRENRPQETRIKVVPSNQFFSVMFMPFQDEFAITWKMPDDPGEYWTKSNPRKSFKLWRIIGAWFGGNRTAPKAMTIDIEFNREPLQSPK
jgi:hypothetical protein